MRSVLNLRLLDGNVAPDEKRSRAPLRPPGASRTPENSAAPRRRKYELSTCDACRGPGDRSTALTSSLRSLRRSPAMPRDVELTVSLADAESRERLHAAIARRLDVDPESIAEAQITRRAIDARGSGARLRLRLRVFATGEAPREEATALPYRLNPVSSRGAPVIVVGAGPAG